MRSVDSILYPEGRAMPAISPCDHYAGNEKLILKSLEVQDRMHGAFDVTCDLEDGAAIGEEAMLRMRVCEIVSSSLNTYRRVGVRLHDFASSHFGADLEEVMRAAGALVSHLTVPKVTGAAQAGDIVEAIGRASLDRGLTTPPIHLLIETHRAVHEVWDIAALPGVRGLDFGIMDFVSAHYGAMSDACMRSPLQFEHPLLMRAKADLVAACLAHQVVPVHSVTTDFKDPEATRQDALRARTGFGFLRMWSIHPNQIEQILAAFRPDHGEIELAAEIVLAAHQADWAPIRHNERLHDRASFRYYWNVLVRAKMAGADLPDDLNHLMAQSE